MMPTLFCSYDCAFEQLGSDFLQIDQYIMNSRLVLRLERQPELVDTFEI